MSRARVGLNKLVDCLDSCLLDDKLPPVDPQLHWAAAGTGVEVQISLSAMMLYLYVDWLHTPCLAFGLIS